MAEQQYEMQNLIYQFKIITWITILLLTFLVDIIGK